jgi:hypothetical protein
MPASTQQACSMHCGNCLQAKCTCQAEWLDTTPRRTAVLAHADTSKHHTVTLQDPGLSCTRCCSCNTQDLYKRIAAVSLSNNAVAVAAGKFWGPKHTHSSSSSSMSNPFAPDLLMNRPLHSALCNSTTQQHMCIINRQPPMTILTSAPH